MNSRLARDHGLRLDSVDDAMDVIASRVDRCIFTTGDVSADFYDLRTRIAGETFQKFINYNCRVAFVLPPEHEFGPRITELAREHACHPVIRFFETTDAALAWQDE